MKIKVVFIFGVLFMALFAGTAYADSYDAAIQTVIIDTPWAASLQDSVNATGANPADIENLYITAGTLANTDAAYIDGSMTALKHLSINGAAIFTATPVDFFVGDSVIEYIEIPVDFTRRYFADNCANLNTIILNNATEIRNDSIIDNPLLTTLTAPNVEEVGYDTLVNNDALVTLSLPSALAFYNSSLRDNDALATVNLPLVEYFEGGQLRSSDSLVTLSLPSLEFLGPNAISGCPLLANVDLPSVIIVGPEALRNNDSLASLSLPSAEYFGFRSLAGNAQLAAVSLPSADTFDERVLQANPALTSVYMPLFDGAGDFTFESVPNAMTLTLGSTVPTSVGWTTFASYDPQTMLAVVHVPINMVDDYDAADGIDGDNMWYGWTIQGIVPSAEPAVNPHTGDDSGAGLAYILAAIALAVVSGIFICARKRTSA